MTEIPKYRNTEIPKTDRYLPETIVHRSMCREKIKKL